MNLRVHAFGLVIGVSLKLSFDKQPDLCYNLIMAWNQTGSLKTRLVGYAIIAAAVLGIIFWRTAVENARARDIQRLADALRIQTAFEKLYIHDRSYADAADHGCEKTDVSIRRCNLLVYDSEINKLADPGKFDYLVTQVPNDTNYEVSFWLERSHGNLARGRHTITSGGIN